MDIYTDRDKECVCERHRDAQIDRQIAKRKRMSSVRLADRNESRIVSSIIMETQTSVMM